MRYDSLHVMNRMLSAVENKSQLNNILCNVPLASYISNTLSSNKSPGVIISSLQLIHNVLTKLPQLYVPLFEQEGVFFEVKKLFNSKELPIESPQKASSDTVRLISFIFKL